MFFKKKKYNTYSDEDLMKSIQRGKSPAFDELYHRYSSKLYFFFYKMLWQNEAKANDFTQELFLKIIENPKSFDARQRFSTWIYTIANNLCKNEYRKKNNQQKAYDQHQLLQTATTTYTEIDFDKIVFETDLMAALMQLPETHRACFILRYKDELAVKEISKILNCPEGTVKSRLFSATQKLRKNLKKHQESYID